MDLGRAQNDGSPAVTGLLQVHQLATYLRLSKMATVSRYLEARIREPTGEKTISRCLTRARRAADA